MRANIAAVQDLQIGDMRLDASYHASSGHHALRVLRGAGRRTDRLDQVCLPDGIFIPGRFRRVYVDNPQYGLRWLSPSDMQKADLSGLGYVSRKYTPDLDILRIQKGWILLSRSGTIGNLVYVRSDMDGLIGSDDIIRIAPNPQTIYPGYLYALLSNPAMVEVIQQKTYGAVIPHIEAHHVVDLPIPRLDPTQEEEIHQLIEQASELRVLANQRLQGAQDRFYRQVLELDPDNLHWHCRDEHSFGIGTANIHTGLFRMDGFHYVGYVGEGEQKLGKTIPMGNLVDPYQPSQFKRPYTGETGTPFLSGIDLFNCYPKTRIYISSKMKNLERYLVSSGTILVQCDGSRDGLIAHPTIMPHHLNNCAVTQHMARLYPKNPSDRGYVYIWLSTELGRRILLKHSSGSVMGSLFERSFLDAIIPDCSAELRYSFEPDLQSICTMREQANELEDQAQKMLLETLGIAL
jgi:type I restriction enzyme S subunit